MNVNQLLKDYQVKLEELVSQHESSKSELESKILDKKNKSDKLILDASTLLKRCKQEIFKKYQAEIYDEFISYLTAFAIPCSKEDYCGDETYCELLKQLTEKNEIYEETKNDIINLEDELSVLNKEFNDKVEELTKTTKQLYEKNCELITTEISLSDDNIVSDLPLEINIGNIRRKAAGSLVKISGNSNLRYPLTFNIRTSKNIIIDTSKYKDDQTINDIFTGLIFKFMSSFPGGYARLGVIDYIQTQEISQIFNALSGTGLALFDGVIDTASNRDKLLLFLKEQAKEISMIMSNNDSTDLYGLFSKEITSNPFHFIFIKNAIKGISEESLNILYNLSNVYFNCGIRFIWLDDFSDDNSSLGSERKSVLGKIFDSCSVYRVKSNGIFDTDDALVEFVSLPKDMGNSDVFEYFVNYKKTIGEKDRKTILFEDIGFNTDSVFYDKALAVPVGKSDNELVYMYFAMDGEFPVANMIIGDQGSGKSVLIDTFIFNAAIKYSPNDIEFHLIDFKNNSTSNYKNENFLIPHIKKISENNDVSEAKAILQNIYETIRKRNGVDFAKAALVSNIGKVDDLYQYRKIQQKYPALKILPQIIVVIDECQHILDSAELLDLTEMIVREGRSAGIHLLLATQKPNFQMNNKIADYIDGRWCFYTKKETADNFLNNKAGNIITTWDKKQYRALYSLTKGVKFSMMKPAYHNNNTGLYSKIIREKYNVPCDLFVVGESKPLYSIDYNYAESKGNTLFVPLGCDYQDKDILKGITLNLNRVKSDILLIGDSQNVIDSLVTSLLKSSTTSSIDSYVVNGLGVNKVSGRFKDSAVKFYKSSDYLTALQEVYNIYADRNSEADTEKQYNPILFVVTGIDNVQQFIEDASNSTMSKEEFEKEKARILSTYTDNDEQLEAISVLRKRMKYQSGTADKNNKVVSGQKSMIELIKNGYRVNIIVCLSVMNDPFSNDDSYSYSKINELKNIKHKIIFNSLSSKSKRLLNDRVVTAKLLSNLSNYDCLFETEEIVQKIKILQYED